MYLHCCTVSDNIMCALTLKYNINTTVAACTILRLGYLYSQQLEIPQPLWSQASDSAVLWFED